MGGAHHHGPRAIDLDRLARGDSPLHRLDPRAKALAALALIVAIVHVGTEERKLGPDEAKKLAVLLAALLAAALAARLPLRFLVARAMVALPFLAFFVVTAPFLPGPLEENLGAAGLIVAKALLSVFAATVLVATTPWHRLLQGLERLWVPRALVLVLHFLHRYLFVLMDEVASMRRAREARLVTRPTLGAALASGSGMIGALFLRTLERAERVEAAMLSRGFTGEVRTLDGLRLGASDVAFLAGAAGFAALVATG